MSAAAAALPEAAFGQAPASVFPKGAIIRTLLKDYAPDELAGGATLFHEHMSLAPDFNARFAAATAAARAANGLPPLAGRVGGPPAPPPGPDPMRDVDLMAEELAAAKRDGVACIVDAGHPDMGRDLGFVRQASRKSGVPVVASAGLYAQPFYPREISMMSEEQVVQALLKQVDADPIGAVAGGSARHRRNPARYQGGSPVVLPGRHEVDDRPRELLEWHRHDVREAGRTYR